MNMNPLIIATFAMSFVCSVIFAIGCILVVRWQLVSFNIYLVELCQHFDKYAKLVVYEDKRRK